MPAPPGVLPPQLEGKNINSPERARELQRKGEEFKRQRRLDNSLNGLPPLVEKRPTRTELDALYVQKAFKKPWDSHYRDVARKLKRQYVQPGGESAQYAILIRHVATLDTLVAQLETVEKPDRYLLLKHRDQLRDFVGQLQRYTEAEKREVLVQETVMVQTLTKVIAVADSTISDPVMRSAFLRALRLQIGDESARDGATASQLGPGIIDMVATPRATESANSKENDETRG